MNNENRKNECVVIFGIPSGWSSYFQCPLEKENIDMQSLWHTCNKRIPKREKELHPENLRTSWIKIFRFESEKICKSNLGILL